MPVRRLGVRIICMSLEDGSRSKVNHCQGVSERENLISWLRGNSDENKNNRDC